MSEFETENTVSIVCPYCGHTHEDSWEYDNWSGTRVTCHSCGVEFELHVEVTVEYTTERVELQLARRLHAHLGNIANNSGARFHVAHAVVNYGVDKMPVGFLELLLQSFEEGK